MMMMMVVEVGACALSAVDPGFDAGDSSNDEVRPLIIIIIINLKRETTWWKIAEYKYNNGKMSRPICHLYKAQSIGLLL